MQFRSASHALRWSYQVSSIPIVKISSVNEMRGAETSGESVTPHDKHAQAALIIALCARVLPPLHLAYVQVQFGRDASGFELLCRQIAGNLGTGLHSRRGIEKVIRFYCGEKGGLREIKRALGCGLLKAASFRNCCYDTLDAIDAQAMDIIWTEMENRKLRVAVYSPHGT